MGEDEGGRVGRGAPAHPEPARKRALGRRARALRLLAGALDPRAWAHAVRLVNYYNYAHVAPRRQLTQGKDVAISPNAVFSNAHNIRLGDRVSVGARVHLWAGPERGRITVGDDVLFGPEVMVTAASYRYDDGRPVTRQAMDEADVEIGADAWLGTRAVVLPGARIGAGAIIGAGALVRGTIPPDAIAVGAPARIVGRRRVREG
jgi:acetyltransferase-like isoleucine patch superfamily enzyme